MSLQIKDFLTAVSGDSKFYLNLPVFWTITFDGVGEGAINSVLQKADEKWKANTSPLAMTKNGNIIVAQSVTLPTEQSNFMATDFGSGMGGYLPGYGLINRSNFLERSFSVNFLETQMDIEHNYFRPWLIAIGIKGLVEYGTSLKANVEVRQYSNQGRLIKGFKFKKVFPTAVESYTLNYENTDFPIKSVTFACENYEQLVGNSNDSTNGLPEISTSSSPYTKKQGNSNDSTNGLPEISTSSSPYTKKQGNYYQPDGVTPLTGNDLKKAENIDKKINESRKRIMNWKKSLNS